MSDPPRFENVDLTPTWDDVDPAALDLGVDSTDIDVDAVELNPQPLPPQPEPEPEPVLAAEEPVPQPEFAVALPEEAPGEGAFWEQSDGFDSGPIEAEALPDDFDDLT